MLAVSKEPIRMKAKVKYLPNSVAAVFDRRIWPVFPIGGYRPPLQEKISRRA